MLKSYFITISFTIISEKSSKAQEHRLMLIKF